MNWKSAGSLRVNFIFLYLFIYTLLYPFYLYFFIYLFIYTFLYPFLFILFLCLFLFILFLYYFLFIIIYVQFYASLFFIHCEAELREALCASHTDLWNKIYFLSMYSVFQGLWLFSTLIFWEIYPIDWYPRYII